MKQQKFVIGIDEAGRGPLAGPVYVGLVLAPQDFSFGIFDHLDDSKKMTEKRREKVVAQLEELPEPQIKTIATYSSAATIDREGIQTAIAKAITEGLEYLAVDPNDCWVFLDGTLKAPEEFLQETIIGGDGKVPAISLASVVAKVARDRYMQKISEKYPEYNLGKHKGYGTKEHREAIRKYGPSDIHRKSFLSKII